MRAKSLRLNDQRKISGKVGPLSYFALAFCFHYTILYVYK
jgi:hypothetical protein